MKRIKLGLVIMATALLAVGVGGVANAFHSGGVAECAGCHSMHSSAGPHLLISTSPSATCLYCHERLGDTGPRSYHVATPESELVAGQPPIQRSPGGDFAWLKKNYAEYRRFVYWSDVVWLRGKVVRKYVDEDGDYCVDIKSSAYNQRGEDTIPGYSTVALPSRDNNVWPLDSRLTG